MGPSAYRAAGLGGTLTDLGFRVEDRGNVAPAPMRDLCHENPAVHHLPHIEAWTRSLSDAAFEASGTGIPIFLGGDHSLSAGTIAGVARRTRQASRELFVLWLDAHPDFHTLDSTRSGNLHGTPMAYVTGRDGFAGFLPPIEAAVRPQNVCMIGIRSVDPAERDALTQAGVQVHDMRAVDEIGIAPLLRAFLDRVEAADGLLHVSLDVDFLDPGIAPGVGTTVPGGASFREAHLAMEMLHDCGRVVSLDLVELNPFLDERGRTACLMVDLAASLMGRKIFDRPTRSF
jgi:arginase